MTKYFNSSPDDMLLAIGPSIRGCCYSVDTGVMKAIFNATGEGDYYREQEKKYLVDLPLANRVQAISAGIPDRKIWISSECTCCNPEKFYSYRFLRNYDGSQGGFIGMLC